MAASLADGAAGLEPPTAGLEAAQVASLAAALAAVLAEPLAAAVRVAVAAAVAQESAALAVQLERAIRCALTETAPREAAAPAPAAGPGQPPLGAAPRDEAPSPSKTGASAPRYGRFPYHDEAPSPSKTGAAAAPERLAASPIEGLVRRRVQGEEARYPKDIAALHGRSQSNAPSTHATAVLSARSSIISSSEGEGLAEQRRRIFSASSSPRRRGSVSSRSGMGGASADAERPTVGLPEGLARRLAQGEEVMPPNRRLQRIGKGKQGKCFLVELQDGQMGVLKDLRNGGRQAYQAELQSLAALADAACVAAGVVPRLLGACANERQVLMGHFRGVALPDVTDGDLAVAVLAGPPSALPTALRCWLAVAGAVCEANALGVVHCDVNPWNILVAEPDPVGAARPGAPPACIIDWACARSPSEAARNLPFKRRGDFQPAELIGARVGARTDVFGSAATLLWLLTRRTRKGLEDKSPRALAAYFAEQVAARGGPPPSEAALEALARACSAGLEESWEARCPDVGQLQAMVLEALVFLE